MLNKSNDDSPVSYFIPTLFKDSDDKEFAGDLLKLTVDNFKTYNE